MAHPANAGSFEPRPPRRLPIREEAQMTEPANESCIKCKLMDCVKARPVDCFDEGENMLVIHPDECIDCGFRQRRMSGPRD